MVIQWSIVDLRVSGNVELFEKHVRMKRRFNRIFTTIWIGMSCGLIANFIGLIYNTTQFVLHIYNHSFTVSFFCGAPSNSYLDSFTFSFFYSVEASLITIGGLFIFIPYIGYGLCTMYIILWRLFKGKTGYRTHFHVQLITPLM